MLEFTIYLNPVGKKNSQEIAYPKGKDKPIVTQNKTYKAYEKNCKKFMPKLEQPIDYPCEVTYKFYRKDNRLVDTSNLIACADDCLVKWGVLKDDNFKILISHDGTRTYVDKLSPRTEVKIREM